MLTDVIIMAGGFGERLWPASSAQMPKQFMALNDNLSFLQNSIQRALALNLSGKIIIVTRKDIENQCTKQCFELAQRETQSNKEKILKDCVVLAEPEGRHTSAAIMAGITYLKTAPSAATASQMSAAPSVATASQMSATPSADNTEQLSAAPSADNTEQMSASPTHTILVLTSDHVISPTSTFVEDCANAARSAESGNFVCFTIPPTEPATGYGYIKTGKDIYNDGSVYKIENFKEKPDFETAKKYLSDGNYWWNSGMFAFNSETFLDEMKKCTPEVSKAFDPMLNGKSPELAKINDITVIKSWPELEETYKTVPSIAVDKAIAEKTAHATAVKSNFNWTDVGSWDTFSDLCTNPANEKVVEINSQNNFVYSDIPVALCGVKDLVVVVKNGKLLVMKKGESALVRDASKEMKE